MIWLASHPLAAEAAIAAVLLWGCLASLLPWLRPRHQMPGLWLVVALGVPVLGWITLVLGPLLGLVVFMLGLGVLLRSPLTLVRRRAGRAGQGLNGGPAE